MEANSQTCVERPTNQPRTNNIRWNSCTPEASSGNLIGTVKPKDDISPSATFQLQDHITAAIVRARRRKKLNQYFRELSTIVPALKKRDKLSVVTGETMKYVKQLRERVKTLEEQAMKKKAMESVVMIKKSQISSDDDDSSSLGDNFGTNDPFPEIVARVSDKNVLIRIYCKNREGIELKTLTEVKKLHLCVISGRVISFGEKNLNITVVAKMEEDFSMEVKDLVRHLCSAFQQFMSECD
ncbi:transcription factor bHLH25-like [Telopea speciosissima]|uniref:transcription factor bHLH25-like n=1 Tax=Telopea speciosissima TaxID=54955 RepID=UPI001CC74283|nr:transcription factor bHLH25-like [Telopea speciosissima]